MTADKPKPPPGGSRTRKPRDGAPLTDAIWQRHTADAAALDNRERELANYYEMASHACQLERELAGLKHDMKMTFSGRGLHRWSARSPGGGTTAGRWKSPGFAPMAPGTPAPSSTGLPGALHSRSGIDGSARTSSRQRTAQASGRQAGAWSGK